MFLYGHACRSHGARRAAELAEIPLVAASCATAATPSHYRLLKVPHGRRRLDTTTHIPYGRAVVLFLEIPACDYHGPADAQVTPVASGTHSIKNPIFYSFLPGAGARWSAHGDPPPQPTASQSPFLAVLARSAPHGPGRGVLGPRRRGGSDGWILGIFSYT